MHPSEGLLEAGLLRTCDQLERADCSAPGGVVRGHLKHSDVWTKPDWHVHYGEVTIRS